MCGIAGMLGFTDGFDASEATVERMRDTLVHRGPDDAGTYVDGRVALGHRRLSIVDVSGGHQPFANATGDVWLVGPAVLDEVQPSPWPEDSGQLPQRLIEIGDRAHREG